VPGARAVLLLGLVFVLGPGAGVALGRHRLRPARARLIQEL